MRRYSIFYFISEAFKSLKRNGAMTFASIAVLLSCLLVIGGFSLLVVNIDANLDNLGTLNDIVVFCEPDCNAGDIENISKYIKTIDGISSSQYKSKASHLEDLKNKNEKLYGNVTEEENPLSDTFTIKYDDPKKVEDIVNKLTPEGDAIKKYMADNKLETLRIRKINNRLDLSQKIENIKNAIMIVFIGFLAVLFVVSIFIIINTIKIAVLNRKKEISIMRYIGASAWFIALPFIFEGVMLGIASGVGAFFCLQLGYSVVLSKLVTDLQMITLIGFSNVSFYLFLGTLGIGIFTGVTGSAISLGKYLKD